MQSFRSAHIAVRCSFRSLRRISQMSNERGPSHAVMESRGAYNKHARLPADGAALTLPLLEKAIKEVGLCSGEQPIVIADCGSSQGKKFASRHDPLSGSLLGFSCCSMVTCTAC